MNEQMQGDYALEVDGQLMTEEDYKRRMSDQLQGIRMSLISMRDEWVRHRVSTRVEDRWTRADALYTGEDMAESEFIETLKSGPTKKVANQPGRSRVSINIVQPKVDQAVARMCEILLPVDDVNYQIKSTPIPSTITDLLGNHTKTVDPETGQPTGFTAHQEAEAYQKAVNEATDEMSVRIADVLTESKYNSEQRKGIENGVRLGTMVMKGPFLRNRRTRKWEAGPDGRKQLKITEEAVPISENVDPWDVWFDPAAGPDHQRGRGVWERKKHVTRAELRALAKISGYDPEAIRMVLEQKPTRVTVAADRVAKTTYIEDAYEIWEYHGQMDPNEMQLCSLSCYDEQDVLKEVDFGVVLMINDIVIGVMPSWVPDKSLPYDVWCWRKRKDSPYGDSLPQELENQQRVVTAAWRQVMDNARWSVGGQVVIANGVTPQSGDYMLFPGKVWRADLSKLDDVRKAFTVIDMPSNVTDLMEIVNAAMAYADKESSMPELLGGEKGSAPETVGGMVMMYQNAHAVLRMRVKLYDDEITSPHVTRHYDYQMANDDELAAKCDCQVDARGSTALLEKDIQNQATLNLANVTSNPRYAGMLDPEAELKVMLKAFKVKPEDVMLPKDKIEENKKQPPAPDPRIVASQTALQVKQLDVEQAEKERALKAETMEYDKQREQAEYEIAMTAEQNKRDLELVKLNTTTEQKTADREANAGLKHLEIDTKRQLFNAEAALRVNTGEGI